MLFLCKNEDDRFDVNQSGYEILHDEKTQMIWTYPKDARVHIIDLSQALGNQQVEEVKASPVVDAGNDSEFLRVQSSQDADILHSPN